MGSITQSDGCDLSFVCDNAELLLEVMENILIFIDAKEITLI